LLTVVIKGIGRCGVFFFARLLLLHAILTPFLSFFLSSLFDMVLFGVPLIFLISFSIFSVISFRRWKKRRGGQLQRKAGGRFLQKKSFYHTYDIISGEKWVLGFYSRFATLFLFFFNHFSITSRFMFFKKGLISLYDMIL